MLKGEEGNVMRASPTTDARGLENQQLKAAATNESEAKTVLINNARGGGGGSGLPVADHVTKEEL